MSECSDRRSRKKARTRAKIRQVAHLLFAERGFEEVTIADVAAEADVAVQTVFNHFPTKEELFFAERTPWVDDAAGAIRNRAPGTDPLAALRDYLVATVGALAAAHDTAERRSFIATIEASPALRVHERELVHQAECQARDALEEAWSAGVPGTPADPGPTAALVAATWLATARVLLAGHRPVLHTADAARYAAAIAIRAEDVLHRLATSFDRPSAQGVRRAG